jgi:hypothetical protein
VSSTPLGASRTTVNIDQHEKIVEKKFLCEIGAATADKTVRRAKRLHFTFCAVLLGIWFLVPRNVPCAEQAPNLQDPASVVQSYLRATYARDYIDAYRYLSSDDQRVKDLNRYVQQRGAYYGFALEAAKKLAEFIEIKPVIKTESQNRLQVIAHLKVPNLGKVSPLVLNWNTYQLNALPIAERKKIVENIEKKNREKSLEMNEGEERLELVKEGHDWRIFLNWAAGIKIPLRLALSAVPELDVSVSPREVAIQPGDVFEVFLRIKNRSNRSLVARIGHLIEPQAVADYFDFVECGFLLPVTLPPGEQEYSGRYLLRGSIPESVHQLSLTYDFKLLQ